MQAIVKIREREAELRQIVYQSQSDPGVRALVELATIERDKALADWRRSTGNDLVRFQSQYNAMQQLIDFTQKVPVEFK